MVSKRIRACVISKQDPCGPGGVESVAHGILRELEKHSEFDISVTYYGKGKKCENRWTSTEYRGVRPKPLSPMIYGAIAGLEVCARRFEVVNAHAESGFGYGIVHHLFGRRRRTLFIQTFHGVSWNMAKCYQDGLSGWRRALVVVYRPVAALVEGIAARTADVVVAVSEGVGEELIALYGVDRRRLRIIHNQVDSSVFTPRDKASARERFGLEEGTYLLFVGREHIRKGLRTAVETVEGLRREGVIATLLVVGLDPEHLPLYARRGSVRAMGRVREEDLPYLYNAATVLIHPSRYEGHPIAPLEALASGMPVVASLESKIELPNSPAVEIVTGWATEDYVKAVKRMLSAGPNAMVAEARAVAMRDPAPYQEYVRIIQEWEETNRTGGTCSSPGSKDEDQFLEG